MTWGPCRSSHKMRIQKAVAQNVKVEASVARRLRAPPASATLQGLIPSYDAALRCGAHRSIVVIGNYRFDPITAVSCRAKEHLLHPRRSCFAPAAARLLPNAFALQRAVVEAPGTAPGSGWFIMMSVYRHSPRGDIFNIGSRNPKRKGFNAPGCGHLRAGANQS